MTAVIDPPRPIPIGVVVGSWLSYSETFIHQQVKDQRRVRAVVCAKQRSPYHARFPYDPVVVLPSWELVTYYLTGYAPSFRRALKDHGARMIHAHFGLNGAAILPLVERLHLPLVVTFHGHDVAGLFPENRWTLRYGRYQRQAPRLFQVADRLLACSEELAERLMDAGAPADKIRVHRLGVDLGTFDVPDRPDRDPTVLMIGRLVEKKGMDDGIVAFARARKTVPKAKLHIVGDGPLRAELEALVRAEGLASSVTFAGVQDASAIRASLAQADIMLTPSRVSRNGDRESGVIVLKEAGAMGLPSVGTRHGGIPEIIEDGQTGFLVDERDVGAMQDRLTQLLTDPDLRHRLGRAARRQIERHYDAQRQNERLETLLLEVL